MGFYDVLRFHIVPPVFLVFFTAITQVLVNIGQSGATFDFSSTIGNLFTLGNVFAWQTVGIFYLWGYISLKVPSKVFHGPATPHGYIPKYVANGTQYYLISVIAFFAYFFCVDETICIKIFQNFSAILSVLNITSLLLCVGLILKAMYFPEPGPVDPEVTKIGDLPLAYQFYRGVELHPRLGGVDVKQLTNCRVGMMGWALLVAIFCVAGIQMNGMNLGPIVNACLINIYLLKFFYWETGYFNTLDITLDRAGYYLCWGCLCWVQVFYTFSAYFLVTHPSKSSNSEAVVILMFGLASIILNYISDRQKEVFRQTDGKCLIWGRPAKFLEVQYKDHQGKVKKSKLLISGFWGLARHMNYVFEIMLALSWSLPAASYGLLPFMYVIFLTILLVHRTFRDEKKCSEKYGEGWTKYCKAVPYRFVPYVV